MNPGLTPAPLRPQYLKKMGTQPRLRTRYSEIFDPGPGGSGPSDFVDPGRVLNTTNLPSRMLQMFI